MSNEIILILSIILTYSSVILWYVLFGETGLICWNVIATIAANIEVLILIKAFGLEQTLGNILFTSTFLVTDILSELYGKQIAKKAVNISIATSIFFILISQFWFLYTPSGSDKLFSNIQTIFSNTPRLMISGLVVYAITQHLDVFLYNKCWQITSRLSGDPKKYLWIRNNSSTLISQLVNTILFTLFAFVGFYDTQTLIKIIFSTYIIFIFASVADTPVIYIVRYLNNKKKIKNLKSQDEKVQI